MKFICVQPAIYYYTWQVEVMINNFIENGVNPNDIQIIAAYNKTLPEIWIKLRNSYKNVNFYFYEDTRYKPSYISSIRPHVLHKHWMKHPELEKEVIFYHDCDIIFTKPIDFKELEKDEVCYVSDTVSYIGAQYIRSKGEHLFDIMLDVVGLDKLFVINNEKDSGGAQYILKNIPVEFWNKVYWDSENMYKPIVKLQNGNHSDPFQIWCADMWAVLWNLWFFEKDVKVVKEMSFSWGTSHINEWENHPIYHNAGVVGPNQKLFYKGQYQSRNPYDIKIEDFATNKCSIKYVESIIKTKEITCLK